MIEPSTCIEQPHGITTIDAGYIRPGIASLQLLVEAGHAMFFDTGTSLSLPSVLDVLGSKGIDLNEVDYVVPTHVHLDHAGGAGTMMSAFPNARLIIHPRGARHMANPEKLWDGTVAVYGEPKAKALYGEVLPVAPERTIIADDGFELDFYGRQLRFLDTPGHARHHFCIIDTDNHIIFAGDTMGISYRMFDSPKGPFIFPTSSPVQFEPGALHESIDRLIQTDPQAIYLTHFGKVEPTPRMIDSLHQQIDDFVAIARNLHGRSNFTEALRSNIADYLFTRVKEHGVVLDDRAIKAGLKMDAQLNADGIAIWLSRSQGAET